jgi:hypothetical protein
MQDREKRLEGLKEGRLLLVLTLCGITNQTNNFYQNIPLKPHPT